LFSTSRKAKVSCKIKIYLYQKSIRFSVRWIYGHR